MNAPWLPASYRQRNDRALPEDHCSTSTPADLGSGKIPQDHPKTGGIGSLTPLRVPPASPMTDSAWIRAALERFERPLVLHARRLTGDLEQARDAVQETFLRLVKERREAVEPHLAEWLFTVCRNVALDMRRKGRGMERTEGEYAGGEPEPIAVVATDEQRGRVLELLEGLPARQQEVLRLRFQAGLTYKEIQRVTGDSIGNVGYLIHVGIRSLRERLAGDALEEVAS